MNLFFIVYSLSAIATYIVLMQDYKHDPEKYDRKPFSGSFLIGIIAFIPGINSVMLLLFLIGNLLDFYSKRKAKRRLKKIIKKISNPVIKDELLKLIDDL